MLSSADDLSIIQYDDLVGIHDCPYPLCYKDLRD